MTELVSRVLYAVRSNHLSSPCVTARFKPKGFCHHGNCGGQPLAKANSKVLLRIGFTAGLCYHKLGWALTPPFHPYRRSGGLFLLHFPGGHPRRTLSVILPCEARTFLTIIPFGNISRDCPTQSRILYQKFDFLSSLNFC